MGKSYWSAQNTNPPVSGMECDSITKDELTKSFKNEYLGDKISIEKKIPKNVFISLMGKSLRHLEAEMEEHHIDFRYENLAPLQLAIAQRCLRRSIIKGFSLRNAHRKLCHIEPILKVSKTRFLSTFKKFTPRHWLDDTFLEGEESNIILKEADKVAWKSFVVNLEMPRCPMVRNALSRACQYAMRLGVSIAITEDQIKHIS